VACAPGRVVVTWYEVDEHGYAIGFRELASNKWQNQIQLEGTSTYGRWIPSISAASNGDVFVAYYGTQANQSSEHVYVRRRLANVWQPIWEDATAGLPGFHFILPDIDVNPATNNPHIVCHGYDANGVFRIYHTYRSLSNWWQVPDVVPGAGSDLDGDDVQPSMFFGVDGKAHVVWYEYNSDPAVQRGIKYSLCASEGGPWSTTWLTTDVSSYVQWPNVTVSSTGAGFAVWTKVREPGSYQVWGRTLPAGGFDGPAAGAVVPSRGLALGVSPNPASRGMVVNYSLPAAGNVSLKLYDVSGALAKTVACGYVLPGSHTVSLSRQNLARGAYILKLESGAGNVTRKLIIE